MDAVLSTARRHSSSDAASLPESACSRCAARIPAGVAALPSPSRFALMLQESSPASSGSLRDEGNSRPSTGRSARESFSVSPERSMTSRRAL